MEQMENEIIENKNTTEQPVAVKSKWDKWKIIAIANSVVLLGVTIIAAIAVTKIDNNFWDLWIDVERLKSNLEYSNDTYKPKELDLKASKFQIINNDLLIRVVKVEPYMDEQKFTFGVLNTSSIAMENIDLKISSGNVEKDMSVSNLILPGTMVKSSVVLPRSIYNGDVKIKFNGSGFIYREI